MRYPHARWTSALMLSTLAATGIAFVGRGAEAQESKDVVTVQARILQNGVPVNADLNLTFEVYTASSGGTRLWTESQSNVPVRNGILAISLGTASALGGTFKHGFNATSERWLAIKQGGSEIVPRVRLTAVPYAHAAGTAEIASAIWDGTTGTSLTLSGLVGAGLEQDGSGRIRISSSAAGNGLTGGSGSALAVSAGAGIQLVSDEVRVKPADLENGGSAQLDGDDLAIAFNPGGTGYTRSPVGGGSVTDLDAHLNGIAAALAAGGGGGSGTVIPSIAGGRLSAHSTEPVPTSDVTPTATLYYLPYTGQLVALYVGSAWVYRSIGSSGLSISVSGHTASHVVDVFMYDNSGTPTLETLAWSSHAAGTSARNTAVVRDSGSGVWIKSGAPTRRYLGTIRTVSSSGTKVTDTNAQRFIWNVQNRARRSSLQQDSTSSWTSSSSTWVAANSGDLDWKHEFVRGLDDEAMEGHARVVIVNGSGASGYLGLWVNATSGDPLQGRAHSVLSSVYDHLHVAYRGSPPPGYGVLQTVHLVPQGIACTFYSIGVYGSICTIAWS